jgi:hypothetical protein
MTLTISKPYKPRFTKIENVELSVHIALQEPNIQTDFQLQRASTSSTTLLETI